MATGKGHSIVCPRCGCLFVLSGISESCKLVFISYKFVKRFLITSVLLFILAETYMMCVNGFYVTRNEISVGSDKK